MIGGVSRRRRHAATGGARDRFLEDRKELTTGSGPSDQSTRPLSATTMTGTHGRTRGAVSLPTGTQNGQCKSASSGSGASPVASAAESE